MTYPTHSILLQPVDPKRQPHATDDRVAVRGEILDKSNLPYDINLITIYK